jgi:catechol 2,3-dioxygenase-like lactoylglutathione lyase family enzyme
MTEVPKPPVLAARGGAWFAGGEAQVHLGVEDGFRPARKAQPALRVDGLRELRAACQAAGFPSRPGEPLDGRERAYVHDPFGNRIELIES